MISVGYQLIYCLQTNIFFTGILILQNSRTEEDILSMSVTGHPLHVCYMTSSPCLFVSDILSMSVTGHPLHVCYMTSSPCLLQDILSMSVCKRHPLHVCYRTSSPCLFVSDISFMPMSHARNISYTLRFLS